MSANFDGRDWDTLGERGSLLAGEGWRYVFSGGVRHYITGTVSPRCNSVCGVTPGFFDDWRGTGRQDEYERLASLPKCLRCMRWLGEVSR